MSTFTASLNYLKTNHIALFEKYYGRENLQPNLVDLTGINKILVVKNHDSISDFLLAAPVFSVLKQAFPNAKIGALVHPHLESLAKLNSNIDEVIAVPSEQELTFRKFVKAGWELRKKWDFAIVLNTVNHSLTSDLLAQYSGAKYILGSAGRVFPGTQRNFMYNLVAPIWPDHIHQSEKNLDILRYIGIEDAVVAKPLVLPPNRITKAREELEKKGLQPKRPLIGIHISGGKLFGTWPIGRLAELTRLLKNKYNAQIALFWGEKDGEKAEQFLNYVQFDLFKIAPQKKLNIACFMHLCDALVVNDNWAMHLSAATGTPLVAIFGPTNPNEFKPAGEQFVAIRGQREKADNITVEQVEKALIQLFGNKLENRPPKNPDQTASAETTAPGLDAEPASFFDGLDISEDVLKDLKPELNRLKWQMKTAEIRFR